MNRWALPVSITFAVTFVAGLFLIVVDLYQYRDDLVREIALKDAKSYSRALSTFRTLYTRHVVEPARKAGVQVSHEFEDKEGVIPLPATMTKLLGRELITFDHEDEDAEFAHAFLYSPYPFPWRTEEGIRDGFQKEAWHRIAENGAGAFHQFETIQDQTYIRYATPDHMRAACIDCHNHHPVTPKNDWKIGDVRGILEVKRPVTFSTSQSVSDLRKIWVTLVLLAVVGLSAFVLVLIVITRFKDLASFVEANPSPVIRTDLSGRVLALNEVARNVFGVEAGSKLQERIKILDIKKLRADLAEKPVVQLEVSSSKGEYLVNIRQHFDHGIINYYFMDVTEKKRLEERLNREHSVAVQTSKMASIGELAGGISHEMNTPLGAIMLMAQTIESELERPKIETTYLKELVAKIQNTVTRISRIVKALRTFSRGSSKDPFLMTPVSEIIENTRSLISEKLKMQGVDLRVDTHQIGNLSIQCRYSQIGQVLMNLIGNAQDAIEDLGEKWIQIGAQDLGDSVRLDVMDSGPGVSREMAEKVFDPFYTSKEVGKGTGLGLSVSLGIIEEHQGRIFVNFESNVSCFSIVLPKDQEGNKQSL